MALGIGIIGLPNVGKSTLFNALLKKQAALAANYPFATIEPNIGIVPVPDSRLEELARIVALDGGLHPSPLPEGGGTLKLPPIKPATVEFVDIAGLVKGASEGAGLGNKFLSHIREVSVIAHVVRNFEDADVIREGSVDAKTDYETIRTELILADLTTISKIKDQKSKSQIKNQKEVVDQLFEHLNQGGSANELKFSDEKQKFVDQLFLLSAKPEIIVINVSEGEYTEENIPKVVESYRSQLGGPPPNPPPQGEGTRGESMVDASNIVVICAKIEAELAELSPEDQKMYLEDLGLKKSGLERLINTAYNALGLQSFLTAGEIEVRAWTIKKGTDAQHAAGVIHTDFIKNFIKAEIVSYNDFVELGGWKGARAQGRARMEGRDYVVQDGDIIEFKVGR